MTKLIKQDKKKIKQLLNSKVTSVSTNTLDMKDRIEVNGRWFIEDTNPTLIFGSPEVHNL